MKRFGTTIRDHISTSVLVGLYAGAVAGLIDLARHPPQFKWLSVPELIFLLLKVILLYAVASAAMMIAVAGILYLLFRFLEIPSKQTTKSYIVSLYLSAWGCIAISMVMSTWIAGPGQAKV